MILSQTNQTDTKQDLRGGTEVTEEEKLVTQLRDKFREAETMLGGFDYGIEASVLIRDNMVLAFRRARFRLEEGPDTVRAMMDWPIDALIEAAPKLNELVDVLMEKAHGLHDRLVAAIEAVDAVCDRIEGKR